MMTTSLISFGLIIVGILLFSYPANALSIQQPVGCVCKNQLPAMIDSLLKDVPENWNLYVEELTDTSSTVVYDRNSQHFSIPASNTKLLTTITAWMTYGPQYQIKTPFILYDNNQRLCVVGKGDPTINSTHLEEVAERIASSGVRHLKEVIYDDSYFDNVVPSSWEWGDLQTDDGAHPGTFVLNQNTMSIRVLPTKVGESVMVIVPRADLGFFKYNNRAVTVGNNQREEDINTYYKFGSSVLQIDGSLRVGDEPHLVKFAVANSTEYFQAEFNWFLKSKGIRFDNTSVRRCNESALNDTKASILFITSPPFGAIIQQCLLESNNLFAEMFLRHVGKWNQNVLSTGTSSVEQGLAVMRTILPKFGVNNNTWSFLDGSGISRHNIITPKTLVTLLKNIYRLRLNDYIACLPVAGRSGTLENRFKGTPAEGIVHAKTGTLSGVTALSGYVLRSDYAPVVFSIIVNNSNKPTTYLRSVLDQMVVWLAQLCSC